MLFSVLEMSRTVAFGRDILGAPDVDIEVKKNYEWHNKTNDFIHIHSGLASVPVLK